MCCSGLCSLLDLWAGRHLDLHFRSRLHLSKWGAQNIFSRLPDLPGRYQPRGHSVPAVPGAAL